MIKITSAPKIVSINFNEVVGDGVSVEALVRIEFRNTQNEQPGELTVNMPMSFYWSADLDRVHRDVLDSVGELIADAELLFQNKHC